MSILAIIFTAFVGLDQARVPQDLHVVCGIAFEIPSGWQVNPSPYDETNLCAIAFIPSDWREQWNREEDLDLGEAAFTLTVIDAPLEKAARQTFFESHDGKWFIAGRQGMLSGTEPISFGQWVGMQGYGVFGVSKKEGGMGGLGEALRILVANDCGSSISIEDALPGHEETIHAVLRSVRVASALPLERWYKLPAPNSRLQPTQAAAASSRVRYHFACGLRG